MNLDEFLKQNGAGARGEFSSPAPAPAAQPVREGHLDIDALIGQYGVKQPTQASAQVTFPGVTAPAAPAMPSAPAAAPSVPAAAELPTSRMQPALIEAPKRKAMAAVDELLEAAKSVGGSLFRAKEAEPQTQVPRTVMRAEEQMREPRAETEAERQARLAEERAAATRATIGAQQAEYYGGALEDARRRAAQATADVQSLEGLYPFLARGENPVNEVEQRAYDEYQAALAERMQALEGLETVQGQHDAVARSQFESDPATRGFTYTPGADESYNAADAAADLADARLQEARSTGADRAEIRRLEEEAEQARNAANNAAAAAGVETRTRTEQIVDSFLGVDRRLVTGGSTDVGQLLAGLLAKGTANFSNGFWKTAHMVLDEPVQALQDFGTDMVNGAIFQLKQMGADLDYLDYSDNLIRRMYNASNETVAALDEATRANANTSRAAQIVDTLGTQTVAALPFAMEALFLAPAKAAQAGQMTTQGLRYLSGLQNAKGAEAVGMMAKEGFTRMFRDPQFWTAYLQTAGESYESGLEDGMSDPAAMTYGLLNGFMNAMIEVGGADEALGGIQSVPQRMAELEKQAGKEGVVDFLLHLMVESGASEGAEENLQGLVERSLKGLFGVDVPVFSTDRDDGRAIVNPWTMLQEFGGGFTIGTLLGGGEAAVQKLGETIGGRRQNGGNAAEAATEALREAQPETETREETPAEPERSAPETTEEARSAGESESTTDADITALLTGEITPEEFNRRLNGENPATVPETRENVPTETEPAGGADTAPAAQNARTGETERLNPTPAQGAAEETHIREETGTEPAAETVPNGTGTALTAPVPNAPAAEAVGETGIAPQTGLTEPGTEGPEPGMKRSQTESNSLSGVAERLGGEQNPLYYMPVTERQTLTAAVSRVRADGVGEMERLAAKEHWTAEDVDTAMTIYGALQADGVRNRDFSAAQSWGKVIRARGTSTAQALQAFSKWTRSGSGQAAAIGEQLDGAVGDYEASGGRRGVSPEEASRIRNDVYDFAREFDGLAEDDIEGVRGLIRRMSDYRGTGTFFGRNFDRLLASIDDVDYLREYALRQMSAIADDATQTADVGQKLKTLQVNAMLTRASTFLRNIGGNALFGTQDVLTQDGLGIALDWLVGKGTGRRELGLDKGWFSSKARKAAADAMHKSALEIAGDVNMSGNESRYGTSANRTFKMNGGPVERFFSRWEQLLGYSLQTSDAFFRGKLEAAQQEGLDNIESGLDAEEKAELSEGMADYRLFQNKGTAYGVSKGLHDILNLIGVGGEVDAAHPSRGRQGGFGVGDALLPFPGVPANLGVKALEYSPANIVKGAAELVKLFRDVKMANVKTGQQQQAVMDIARGMVGVPIIAALAAAFKSGVIRNSDDEEDYDEAAQNRAEGRTGVQINLDAWERALNGDTTEWRDGDSLMSIGWLEPLNAFMAIGSLIAQEDGEDATIGSYAKKYYTGALQSILEMPVMQSVSDIYSATRNVNSDNIGEKLTDAAISFAGDAATGLIPAPVSSLAKALDPYQRDTRADTAGGAVLNQLAAAVPWLRETLDVRTDGYGEPEAKPDDAVLRALNELVLPGRVNVNEQTAVSEAMKDLHEATGARTAPDRKAPNSATVGGEKLSLSTEEKKAWEKTYGETYARILGLMTGAESWEGMSDEVRLAAAKSAESFAADTARRQLAEARGLEYSSEWDEEAALAAEDPAEAVRMLAAKAGLKSAIGGRDFDAIDELLADGGAYDSLGEEAQGMLSGIEHLTKLVELTGAGIGAEDAMTLIDAVAELEPEEGKSSVTQEQKVGAILGTELSDEQKIAAIRAYASDSYADHVQAAYDAGIGLDEYREVKAAHDRIDKEDLSATEKAEAFAYELDRLGLSEEQREVLRRELRYSMFVSTGETRYSALREAGMEPDAAKATVELIHALEPDPEHSSVTADQKAEAIIGSDLSDEDKMLALREYTSDSYMEKLQTALDAGLSLEQWRAVRAKYSEIDGYNITAGEKATQFAAALNRMGGLSDEQRAAMRETLLYWSMKPADAAKFNTLGAAGLSTADAERVVQAIGRLEPESGKSSVSQDQRVDAILSAGLSDADTWAALGVYASESWVTRARAAVDAGVPLKDYVWASNMADTNENGSLSQDEMWAWYRKSPLNETFVRAMWPVLWPKTDFEEYAKKHGGL